MAVTARDASNATLTLASTDTGGGAHAIHHFVQGFVLPATFLHGVVSVTTAGTRVPLIGSATALKRYVQVRANGQNQGIIYLGTVTVTSSNGFQLNARDVSPPIEVDDLNKVYIDASISGEGVSYIAL